MYKVRVFDSAERVIMDVYFNSFKAALTFVESKETFQYGCEVSPV